MRKKFRLLALILTLGLLFVTGRAQVRLETRHYSSSTECGFEFDYPSDWTVVPSDDPSPCKVRLRPANFAARMKELDLDVYTLDVARFDTASFLAAAAEEGFDFVRGRWVLLGRHSMRADAEAVATGAWHGLRGFAPAGCYDQDGKYVGVCEQPVLVLRDDDANVWSMRGGPESEQAFDRILATFQVRAK